MCSDVVMVARGLGKSYRIFDQPAQQLNALLRPSRAGGTELAALSDVSFDIRRGESVAIIGRNGSGKSTLLQLICGILSPSAGSVKVEGRVVGLLELGTSFDPEFTGRENARLTAAVYGLPESEIEARLPAILAFSEIGDALDRPVREYSSGMFARLAFSVCAHVDADILVIDEILAVGDTAFQQKCMRFLRTFKAGGGTLLFVSHGEHAVISLCQRALWLEHGRLDADGSSKDVYRAYARSIEESGGVLGAPSVTHSPAPTRTTPIAAVAFSPFVFDPDDPAAVDGRFVIEQVALLTSLGAAPLVFEGGEDVQLRITCNFAGVLEAPVLAFTVRNKLGRIVFSDNTRQIGMQDAGPGAFTARFDFTLPYLPGGDYLVEAFLFSTSRQPPLMVTRCIDQCFFQIQSRHPGGGLANIAPRRIGLAVSHSGSGAGHAR